MTKAEKIIVAVIVMLIVTLYFLISEIHSMIEESGGIANMTGSFIKEVRESSK